MQLFYIPGISGNTVILDQAESKHAIKVLRLTQRSRVQIIDGKGGFYEAEIAEAHPKKCRLTILDVQKETGKKNYQIHIAIAPTKNMNRFEWFLEKATEIGINEITPILCHHSERKIVKPERLEKILVAAIKQSVKAYLPKLNELTPFSEFIEKVKTEQKFIAHCNEGNKPHLKDLAAKGSDTAILIGPEGDFSTDEVELALANGFREISLGTARLRIETAGVVACHIVNLQNE